MKTKIKSLGDEVTDHYDWIFGLDSAVNKDGNYYPQVFLKECK